MYYASAASVERGLVSLRDPVHWGILLYYALNCFEHVALGDVLSCPALNSSWPWCPVFPNLGASGLPDGRPLPLGPARLTVRVLCAAAGLLRADGAWEPASSCHTRVPCRESVQNGPMCCYRDVEVQTNSLHSQTSRETVDLRHSATEPANLHSATESGESGV